MYFVTANQVMVAMVYSKKHYVIKFVSDLIQHYVIKFVSDLIQHYVIKFVSDLIQHYVIKFVVFSTSKTDRNDITEILLKVALSTISQTSKTFELMTST